MPHPLETITELAASARTEAARMLAAVEGKEGVEVRLPVDQFRRLAGLLAALGRSAGACGGCDCLGAPVDGVRLWVTREAGERRQADTAWPAQPYETRAARDLTL